MKHYGTNQTNHLWKYKYLTFTNQYITIPVNSFITIQKQHWI